MSVRYADRTEAGRALVEDLVGLDLADQALVAALPRGGVPVGRIVADELDADLDVLLVRKIGVPGHAELGIGAVGELGVLVMDDERMRWLGLDREVLDDEVERQRLEVRRRAEIYRAGQPPVDVQGRPVIVVDDGIATGGTATAAVEVMRRRGASKVVVAVPVGSQSACERLRDVADAVVCPYAVRGNFAVGAFYDDFHQLDDDEVRRWLEPGERGPA